MLVRVHINGWCWLKMKSIFWAFPRRDQIIFVRAFGLEIKTLSGVEIVNPTGAVNSFPVLFLEKQSWNCERGQCLMPSDERQRNSNIYWRYGICFVLCDKHPAFWLECQVYMDTSIPPIIWMITQPDKNASCTYLNQSKLSGVDRHFKSDKGGVALWIIW